jgi:hypothetical protein
MQMTQVQVTLTDTKVEYGRHGGIFLFTGVSNIHRNQRECVWNNFKTVRLI